MWAKKVRILTHALNAAKAAMEEGIASGKPSTWEFCLYDGWMDVRMYVCMWTNYKLQLLFKILLFKSSKML